MTSIVSAITGSGAKKAASAQAAAGERAIELQEKSLAEQIKLGRESLDLVKLQYEESKSFTEPYRKAGSTALSNYESLLYGIPINQTSSYRSARAQDVQSREDIRAELLPQFTTQTQSNVSGNLYSDTITGQIFDINNQASVDNYIKSLGHDMSGRQGAVNQILQSGNLESLEDFRIAPVSQPTTTENIDYNALDAAVEERYAGQQPSVSEGDDGVFDFTATPSYEFRRGEGEKALERSAAARSGVLSGRQLKAQERFAQDYASSEYDKVLSRIGGLADTGLQASQGAASGALSSGQTQAGILSNLAVQQGQYGANVSDLTTGIGAARASGYLGVQQAGTNTLNMLAGFAGSGFG